MSLATAQHRDMKQVECFLISSFHARKSWPPYITDYCEQEEGQWGFKKICPTQQPPSPTNLEFLRCLGAECWPLERFFGSDLGAEKNQASKEEEGRLFAVGEGIRERRRSCPFLSTMKRWKPLGALSSSSPILGPFKWFYVAINWWKAKWNALMCWWNADFW